MTEIIKFDDPVVLVGGAEIAPDLLDRFSHFPVVAADGGANQLRGLSVVPSVVIGDLDSVRDKSYWQSVSRVVEITEQDTTDFEKCLYSVEAPYFIALGFSGNRIDHTLASLHVMQKMHAKKQVLLVSDDDVVCVCSKPLELSLPPGTRVSVYPLEPVTFDHSTGLVYPLNGLAMQPGVMIGTSNTSSESRVTIVPTQNNQGCFALILPVECLQSLIDTTVNQVPAI